MDWLSHHLVPALNYASELKFPWGEWTSVLVMKVKTNTAPETTCWNTGALGKQDDFGNLWYNLRHIKIIPHPQTSDSTLWNSYHRILLWLKPLSIKGYYWNANTYLEKDDHYHPQSTQISSRMGNFSSKGRTWTLQWGPWDEGDEDLGNKKMGI